MTPSARMVVAGAALGAGVVVLAGVSDAVGLTTTGLHHSGRAVGSTRTGSAAAESPAVAHAAPIAAARASSQATHPAPQAAGAPPPVLLAGAYWKQLAPAEKQAYVSGFLAGAAAEQVRAQVRAQVPAQGAGGRAEEGGAAASSVTVETLRASHALRFPFGPAVYAAQLDDYYWWENHAGVPILDAMTEINARMMAQQEQGAPQR
jgi:hypothetical protein